MTNIYRHRDCTIFLSYAMHFSEQKIYSVLVECLALGTPVYKASFWEIIQC